jgi:DNA-binding beta-propeller fold protein YncE
MSPLLPRTAELALLAVLAGCGRAEPPSRPLRVVGSLGVVLGRFSEPRAIAVDPRTGRFHVADRTGRIQLFEPDGEPILEWRLPEYRQGQPVGLAVEPSGTLLVNDSHYHRILRYEADGSRILASWGSEGKGPGQLTFGRDVVVDSDGFIYAGDYGGLNDRILKFSSSGEFILEWGGKGDAPGKFERPQGMAVEKIDGREETILVADCANHRVQRFARDGEWLSSFGTLGTGPGELKYPMGVAVGSDGSIYVSEWGNNRVQRFDAAGRPAGFWGRPGRAEGELATPWEIAVAPGDRLLIADCGNNRVQVFEWPGSLAATRPARRAIASGPRRE